MNADRVGLAHSLRILRLGGSMAGVDDGELLERYASRVGEPAEMAFSVLVERHGPMVLRVCRSTLRDNHAAEDAFQATFLVLARRARTLWVRDSLAPWLHQVAYRVSIGARVADRRRKNHELRSRGRGPRSYAPATGNDLDSALHEEIERLPTRLKGAVILCHLDGLTHEEAAARLACPVGTVRSRLSRGRERLRRGLARRGYDSASASIAPFTLLPPLNPTLVAGSARAATQLASGRASLEILAYFGSYLVQGVILPMTMHPLKTALILLMTGGAVAVGYKVNAGQEPAPTPATKPAQVSPAAFDDDRRVIDLKIEIAALKERLAEEKEFRKIERWNANTEVKLLSERLDKLEARLGIPAKEVVVQKQADPKARDNIRAASAAETPPYKIRSRFAALAETVFVKPGQDVKKGDPIITLHGPDLATAAGDCQRKFVQWGSDRKFLTLRESLAKEGRITQLVWVETQNDEKKSRLDYLLSRDKLAILGMKNEQIEEVLEEFQDDPAKVRKADHTRGLVRLTITAPFDATVTECHVEANDWTEPKDLLFLLKPRDH